MLFDVEMIGWGMFCIRGKPGVYVWDDYPDDLKHDGYGVMRSRDGEVMEIVACERDEKDRVISMDLVEYVGGEQNVEV